MKNRVVLIGLVVVAALLWTSAYLTAEDQPKYHGSVFSEVWKIVAAVPETSMPQMKVTAWGTIGVGFKKILQSAKRTIADRSDVLPYFDKVAHPNGICFKGTWNITEPNKYTGQYKQGTQSLIIARASVAMSETTRGHDRGFGLAGKIFNTQDEKDKNKYKTANFFVVDDLGGTDAPNYTGVAMTNEPPLSFHMDFILNHKIKTYLANLVAAFNIADKTKKIGIRQLYEVSELGLANGEKAITPKWMQIQARKGTKMLNESDFRDELNIARHGGQLVFDISVASEVAQPEDDDNPTGSSEDEKDLEKQWEKIGYITLEESIVSKGCDHRLHFHHPKFRKDLIH